MQKSRYNIYHALAAVTVLVFAIKNNFWHTFLHGMSLGTPKPQVLVFMLFSQVALFGLLSLFIWISTLFTASRPRMPEDPDGEPPPGRLGGIKFAALSFAPICLIALSMQFAATTLLEKFCGIELASQDLVQWLQPGTYAAGIRAVLMIFVVFAAPLLEEPLFRGIMFRGFGSVMPAPYAMAASGFIFALVHVNAASFLPLWFLGVAFAWLYKRTGTILAPMTAHFLFNLLNLGLCLFFPELSS